MNTPNEPAGNEQHPSDQPKPDSIHWEPAKKIQFETLAEGQTEVLIEYQGQLYRLRATRNKKLILNK